MLSISNLNLVPGVPALASPDLALAFPGGEIGVVLGRNRSGKTPLCRLIAGLPGAATGQVLLDGEPLPQKVEKSRPVGLVYQAFVNYPHWTVSENIASPMLASKDRPSRSAAVAELAGKVGILHLLDRYPHELSGGQQQRLAIARALAKEPAVLVMDEPFVNIDYKLRESLSRELKQLARDTGVSVIYTTSDPADALALADQIILLDAGKVLQSGKPKTLYSAPDNLVAADLLSDPAINLLGDHLAVRPEHVSLSPIGGMSFDAVITGVETNGAETFVHADVTVEGRDYEWVVKARGMHAVAVGEMTELHVRQDDLLEFEPNSESTPVEAGAADG